MSTDPSQLTSPSGGAWPPPAPTLPLPDGHASPTPPTDSLPAAIGKYTVLSRVGAGAMGVAYKCLQPGLERPVVVKVLLAARHASSEQVIRFQREARAAARLTHPNVVQIYDVGIDGEFNYLVMEYVEGWSLDQLIGRPPLTVDRALWLLVHVARALQAAHDQGIIHRDIKPSNILIHRSGQPKLADFGLAKSLHESQTLSGSSDLIGTPRYMSPEQVLADSRELDARSDIYSLGAVMYEMLTGQPPHDAANVLEILRKVTDEEPAPPRQLNPAIPDEVEAICLRALAKDPEERFASAGQVATAIQAYLLKKLRRAPEGSDSAPEAEWLSALMVPMARPTRRRRRLGRTLLALGGGILLGAALALVLSGWIGHRAEEQRTAQVVAQAREQLSESLNLRGNTSPRDQLQAILEDLTVVLKRSPDHADARWLRARAYRWAGEHLAALNDLTELLRRHPDDRAAIVERLLTNYQLFVLYLGNLNDPLLRPMRFRRVQEDVQTLKASGDPALERVAGLVEALARQHYDKAARLAEAGMPSDNAPVGSADVAMLEADALFHAAVEAHGATQSATGEDREASKGRREKFIGQATQALRRGLRSDPNHIGLLFLKANAVQRSAAWETPDSEDRAIVLHRLRPTFDAAVDRFRRASLGLGCETAIARAVLLMNYDPEHMAQLALNEIRDALSYRPTASSIYSLRAWLQLLDPAGGGLTTEEAKAVLRDMEPGFETPTDDYHPYFIRAVVQAAAGQWEQARLDLQRCHQNLGRDTLPTSEPAYNRWFGQRGASTTPFLYATLELLMDVPIHVAVEARMHLAEEVLKRLAEPSIVERDKLGTAEVDRLRAWTHFRLAKLYIEQRDSSAALPHVEQALSAGLADLTAQTCRTDPVLRVWDDDSDFFTLYQKFDKR